MDKVIFLGTSAGMPTLKRNVPAIALMFSLTNEFWLFDCGEGTQQQINQTNLKLSKLTNIFITHLHGDHIFGLPGLLATRGLLGVKKPINIFGPVGLEGYLQSALEHSSTYLPYTYNIYLIKKTKFLTPNLLEKIGIISIYCAILNHHMDSFGYTLIKRDIKRNLQVDKLLKLGIPPGPIYKKFKEEDKVQLEDGRIFQTSDFITEGICLKKLCYCGDTTLSVNAISLSERADLLIHEATYGATNQEKARQHYHSTVEDAINVARRAKVKRLALTHISPRYDNVKNISNKYNALQEQFSRDDPEIIIAEDFMELEI